MKPRTLCHLIHWHEPAREYLFATERPVEHSSAAPGRRLVKRHVASPLSPPGKEPPMSKSLLLCLVCGLAVAAETVPAPVTSLKRLDLQSFEQPMPVTGWIFYAWGRSRDAIAATVVAEGDGKVAKIDAVDKGAAGIASKMYAIETTDTAWQVTLRVKASADYAGNVPWIFLAAVGKDGFLPPAINVTPKVVPTATWTTVTVTVPRANLPAGATSLAINLTSSVVMDAKPAGSLFLDDIAIEAVR